VWKFGRYPPGGTLSGFRSRQRPDRDRRRALQDADVAAARAEHAGGEVAATRGGGEGAQAAQHGRGPALGAAVAEAPGAGPVEAGDGVDGLLARLAQAVAQIPGAGVVGAAD